MIQNMSKIIKARMPDMMEEAIEESVSDETQAILVYLKESHEEIKAALNTLADNQRQLLGVIRSLEEKIENNE